MERKMSAVDDHLGPVASATGVGQLGEMPPLSSVERTHSAERVIQDHVLLSIVSGFIPGPAIDMAVAFAVQLTMLKRLSTVYEVPFSRDAAKSIITALLGSLGGAGASALIIGSFIKSIPIIGTVVGIAGTAVTFGAFTYAIGKVFQRHFELGGTFIDLDVRAYRGYFREMNERGKTVAAERKREAEDLARAQRRAATSAAEAVAEGGAEVERRI